MGWNVHDIENDLETLVGEINENFQLLDQMFLSLSTVSLGLKPMRRWAQSDTKEIKVANVAGNAWHEGGLADKDNFGFLRIDASNRLENDLRFNQKTIRDIAITSAVATLDETSGKIELRDDGGTPVGYLAVFPDF